MTKLREAREERKRDREIGQKTAYSKVEKSLEVEEGELVDENEHEAEIVVPQS